jgi:hypothetical protein
VILDASNSGFLLRSALDVQEMEVTIHSCIPVIPSMDLDKSLRLWRDGLGFEVEPFAYKEGRLTGCLLASGHLVFMLHDRAGKPEKPDEYEGIRLYWAPENLRDLWSKLRSLGFPVSEITKQDFGHTEFFLTDADGFDHCFGVKGNG